MKDQKERAALGFGGSFEAAPPSELAPTRERGRPDGVLRVKLWMIGVGMVLAAGAIFGLMQLLSSASEQVVANTQGMIGQVDQAHNVDAQTAAQTALEAAKSIYSTDVSYAGVNPVGLAQAQPGVRYTSGASTDSKVISLAATDTQVGIAVSSGKTCWYLLDSATAGTTYGKSDSGACTGQAAMSGARSPSWQ